MIEIKKDCFAYQEEPYPKCKALKELYCVQEKCNFYKPKKIRPGVKTDVRYKPH